MDAPLTIIPDAEYNRREFIGGSNIAAIIGVGAYGNTPLTAYYAKLGQGGEEFDPKRELFLQRRKRWEGPIVEMLREEFDGNIIAVNRRYRDREHPYLAAEIDFEWVDENGDIQNGEIKTVSPFAFGERDGWGEAGTSDIPVHYAAQVMHGLGVTGRRVCIVAAMVGLDNMVFYPVSADDETIAYLRERAVNFWTNHVLLQVPPDPISYEDCLRLALRMRGRPVELDDATWTALEQLRQLRLTAKAMEGDESDLKFAIGRFVCKAWGVPDDTGEVPENAILRYNGQPVGSFNVQSTRRIDSTRLKAEEPTIAAEFTKTSTTRILRISKPK